ncbi:hypothetical protein [Chitinophaga sp. 22620]|uniref:hypothetical protein n=1 Tax=Chitinophaga sp. 22620 TaxID=3453952 RepID=UPI003F87370A
MKLYLIAAAVLLASTSCKKNRKDHGKFNKEISPVVKTELQDAGVARSIKMEVTFIVFNGCGQFDSFSSSIEADTLVMQVVARYPQDALCTDDLPRRTTTFTKTYSAAGTYYIKWVGPAKDGYESQVHRDTIIVR